MKSNKIKHNNIKLIKFCLCDKCKNILIKHILNLIDNKIKILLNKKLCKKNHKSI